VADETEIWIELRGLRVDARIGVSDAELAVERPLLIDVDLIPARAGATATDELADTVDYAAVAAVAERVATATPHRTLERLAAEIVEGVLALGGCAEVGVRVAKPEPPMKPRVDQVAVRVARSAA
jgi:7,8-dihydroneopterin aldolase/epimerase/oxygenase